MGSQQLELVYDPVRSREDLHRALQERNRRTVLLALTRNRVSMVSIRFEWDCVSVRLHRAFLAAPNEVVSALARYLRSRRKDAWRIVSAFADRIVPDAPPGIRPVEARGKVYNLDAVRRKVTAEFFGRRMPCRVGWGRRGGRRRRARSRHIRYGSYVPSENLVRINPLLDDARVPERFLEYIVFHEMLHAVVPSEHGVRRQHHTRVFRQFENRFPDVEAMRRLCSELVTVLAG